MESLKNHTLQWCEMKLPVAKRVKFLRARGVVFVFMHQNKFLTR
jgi:hypothetical protein